LRGLFLGRSPSLTLATGWHGVELSGFRAGETIAVFGAGPVGLMAAYSAVLRGASRVFVVDRVPERLKAAEKIGCIPVDFTKSDAVDQIIKLNDGMVDRSVDAVGYQAVDNSGSSEVPNIIIENMIRVTRACGGLGIPGLYVPRYALRWAGYDDEGDAKPCVRM
jgi:threonine dehydrogenase-like Zn-dependent dehydrogenase